jgi:hypothetical protein
MIYIKNFFYEKYKDKIKEDEKKVREKIKQHYVQIYKGKLFKKNKHVVEPLNDRIKLEYQFNKTHFPKVIIFDLDETLGSFAEIESLWSGIINYSLTQFNQHDFNQNIFNKLIDLYPEFLRTGILEILSFVINKKRTKECFRLYIYTNNQCAASWTNIISSYISSKVGSEINIFDRNIYAFKCGEQIIEPSRTTNDKTYSDFIQCTMLSKTIELCFIDNTYFDKMKHDKVYYIQPRSYYHGLSYKIIMDRFGESNILNKSISNSSKFLEFMYNWFQMKETKSFYKIKTQDEYDADIIIQQKIMYNIKEFFYMSTRNTYTKKIRSILGRYTKKNR